MVKTMHRNEEKRKRGNRIAAAAAFVVLGAVIAWCGAGLQPGSGTVSIAGTEEATPSSAAVQRRTVPAIWYEDDGLYLFRPDKQETLKLSSLKDGGMDRMTRYLSGKNPASFTYVVPDRTGVYYMKDLTTDYVGITRGNLWYRALPEKGEAPGEVPVAEKVLSCRLLSDGSIVWLDDNASFYILSGVPGSDGAEPQKIAAGIKEYYAAKEEPALFLVNETGKAYSYRKDTGKRAVAEGIEKVGFVSDDLQKIYYRTKNKDLFYVEAMGTPRIVDVDVEEVAVIRKTGNAYYLKENQVKAPASSGAKATLPPADQMELTPEEKELVGLRINELLEGTAENAANSAANSAADGYQLGYYDGTSHTALLRGVIGIDDNHLEETEKDRLVVYTGENDGYSVWFMMDEKPLYTGLSTVYEGLMDLCPDIVQDVLYVARQREDQIGSPDQGGIYAMHYTEKGFTNPEPLFEGAVIITAARDGKVYTGTYPIPDEGSTLIVDGVKISDHVASFFWDESGVSESLQIYRNVFYGDYYVSGEVDDWNKEDGIRPIAYNVKEYHGFEDGSFTMLCDYDEDELTGKFVYWDGDGEPVVLSERASGTRPGQGEE
ncbi:MAG: hypothetical protein IJT43_09735 [Stomatobaculum sp.]|nr:hypothetical protein [Stomatobaculum sp.]